jgi:hypothetical protein
VEVKEMEVRFKSSMAKLEEDKNLERENLLRGIQHLQAEIGEITIDSEKEINVLESELKVKTLSS